MFLSGHHYDPLVAMSVTFGISYEQTPWNKNWDPPAFPLWREENLLKESEPVLAHILPKGIQHRGWIHLQDEFS